MIVQRLAEIYFHNLYILDLFLYCSSFRCALSFQPSSPAPNYDNDGTVIYDKPDSSNSFYIKRKDGKGYDLYVKHEDAFINSGIIENPEDYKGPKIYSSKKEATKFYENIK